VRSFHQRNGLFATKSSRLGVNDKINADLLKERMNKSNEGDGRLIKHESEDQLGCASNSLVSDVLRPDRLPANCVRKLRVSQRRQDAPRGFLSLMAPLLDASAPTQHLGQWQLTLNWMS